MPKDKSKPKTDRNMPINTQISTFTRMYMAANKGRLDESFKENHLLLVNEDEYSDFTTRLDPNASFAVNKAILEDAYPDWPLQLPKETKRKGPRHVQDIYKCKTPEGIALCADALVVVQSQKTYDKKDRVVKALGHPFEYEFGRIQLTFPKELIGTEARVHIEFVNPPEIKAKLRRGRHVFDYHQIGNGGHFSKKKH